MAAAAESKTVAILVTNHGDMGDTGKKTGYYLPEVAHPYKEFTEAGFKVEFVSPSGGACPCDPSSIEATKEDESCTSFHADKDISAALESTKKFADVDVTKYAGVLQAGGHGTCWDFPNEDVAAQTGKAWEAGLVVGSVCHGPVGLANVKVGGEPLVKGKKVCCFTNKEEEAMGLTKVVPFLPETRLTELGAVFVGAENWACNCQVDGKLVTGQNPASAGAVAKEMIKLM